MATLLGSFITPYTKGEEVFGKKPVIPKRPSYEDIATRNVAFNLGLLPQASALAQLSTAELLKGLEAALPGYGELLKTGTRQISSQLRGELPSDVGRLVSQRAAERAVAGGFGGSGMGRNLELRDLGLTSLDVINQALPVAERWMAQAQGRTFDFSKMFLLLETAIAGAEEDFQTALLEAGIEAAPDPETRGQFDTAMTILGMAVSMYGGEGYRGMNQQQSVYGNYAVNPQGQRYTGQSNTGFFQQQQAFAPSRPAASSGVRGGYDFNQDFGAAFGGFV